LASGGADTVIVYTSDNPMILFYLNPYYADWIQQHFGLIAYSIIGKRLLKLAPRVQGIVDNFKAKHFGKYNIGVQIRTERSDCSTLDYLRAAAFLQESKFPIHEELRFFIASDSKEARYQSIAYFGENKTIMVPFIERYEKDSDIYALADSALLSATDIMLLTYRSSFGLISSATEATQAFVLYKDKSLSGLVMTEPCFYSMRNVMTSWPEDDPLRSHPIVLAQLLCHP